MGLIYSSSDSAQLISALKMNLQSGKEASEQLKAGSQKVITAVDGKTLSGAAYTAGKGLFSELVLPTISKVTSAMDSIEQELQTYTNADQNISSEGTLDEDKLNQQIATKKAMKASVDASAAVARALSRSNPVAKILDALLDVQNNLNRMSNTFEDDIRELQKKLEKLHQFSSQTNSLFNSSLNDMKIAMQGVMVLNNTIVNSDGTYQLPSGFDSSWFTSVKAENQMEVKQKLALSKGMTGLNLPKDAQKYYEEIMKDALKDVPVDQWEKALKELNEQIMFDDDGNILRILPVNMGAGNGIIILKNGVNDPELTQRANDELSAEHKELLNQSLLQLATGLTAALGGLGITGLSLGGTYFSGGTLALVGVTQAGVVAGTATSGVGVAIVSDAINKMGVQAGDVSYSFANNYEQYRKALPEKVVNDLSNFNSKNFKIGNHNFKLDKSGLKHILERHHPDYWNGSVKNTQSFLDKGLSIGDIEDIIQSIMNQNRDLVLQKGTKGMFQISGKVNGVDYTLGFKDGRIGQLFEIMK